VSGPSATGHRARLSAAGALLRTYPVTVVALGALLVAAVASGSLAAGPSGALLRSIGAGTGQPLWTALTAGLWCANLQSYTAAVLGILALLAPAERRLGSLPAGAALVAGQAAGTFAGLMIIHVVAGTGAAWGRELAGMVVVGPFPGLLAVAGLHTAWMPALWRRRVRLSLSISLLALILYSGTTGDVLRLSGWLLGLTAGTLLHRPRERLAAPHPSRREERALVALVVAVTALGPLVAALSRTPDGPWAVVSHLFVSGRPHPGLLRAVCGPSGDPADCGVLRARAHLTGRGPALLSVLPVVLQLALAEGLRRGRRAAWVAAVGFSAVLTVVGGLVVATVLSSPADALPMLDARPESLPAVSVVAPLVAPLAVLLLLLFTRTRFGVRAAPGSARRWLVAAAAGLAGVTAVYVCLGSLVSREFAGGPSTAQLLADLPVRMLPPGYLGEVLAPLVPRHAGARVLADWAGVAAWTILLVTAVRLVRPTAPAGDAVRARSIVEQHGDGPLSFMTTWVGNRYWFSADGSSVVAYRVIGGVALTTGDPVGPRESRGEAVDGFTRWCEEHGWVPCWYSVSDEFAETLSGTGAHRLQVAAETWLPLGDLSFTGRRWQDVRTALNRAAREGVRAEWVVWSEASTAMRAQVAELSEEWLATKGLPEMGFTLGGLDELADDAVRCLVAVDKNGRVQALTSWLPAYQEGRPVGWTLDVMRRSRGARPGVVEFLIATAALSFQAEGSAWISLSGAPLALPPGTADGGRLTRLLELAGRTMEPVYGFRSLLAFKAKFQPHYRPLWLIYPGTADLPRIARAVSNAYLPHVSPGQALRLVRAVLSGRRKRAHRPGQGSVPSPGPAPEPAGTAWR
jgi:phosphatidylglycerol lysyltransferase